MKTYEDVIAEAKNAGLPDGWACEEARHTGNFKLLAKFTNRATDEAVSVTPWKSYDDQPGFPDVHRISYRPPEGGIEIVDRGHSVEHSHQALDAALLTIRERGELEPDE
jgi:hypothetical protein